MSLLCFQCDSQETSSESRELPKSNETVETEAPDKTFDELYRLLIQLQQTNNDTLLIPINREFDKYLFIERERMDAFRFDDRFWDYAGYPFFNSIKRANPDNLDFNLFEFVMKIKPYYFGTGEVEEGLSELWAEVAYLKASEFLEFIAPMDSTTRMETLSKPWWWTIPADSLLMKLNDEQLKRELQYVFLHSG